MSITNQNLVCDKFLMLSLLANQRINRVSYIQVPWSFQLVMICLVSILHNT